MLAFLIVVLKLQSLWLLIIILMANCRPFCQPHSLWVACHLTPVNTFFHVHVLLTAALWLCTSPVVLGSWRQLSFPLLMAFYSFTHFLITRILWGFIWPFPEFPVPCQWSHPFLLLYLLPLYMSYIQIYISESSSFLQALVKNGTLSSSN